MGGGGMIYAGTKAQMHPDLSLATAETVRGRPIWGHHGGEKRKRNVENPC